MAHAQKPDFVFRRNGRVHLNSAGASVQSTTGRRVVHISLQGLYCSCKPVFCSHVTVTGYPLHSLVSPSLLLPCVTVCHHISTGLYRFRNNFCLLKFFAVYWILYFFRSNMATEPLGLQSKHSTYFILWLI
jgi:hypothetical protein